MSGAAQTEAPRGLSGPYVGLTYYTEDDTDLFFGRDAETGVIISNLRASRLTLLYAESGVGKSSLLRAGVAARLRRQAAHDAATRGAPRFVPVVFSSWSGDPVLGLTAAVEEALHGLLPQGERPRLPRDDVERAVEAAAAAAADSTLLVILDQFEEYFLYRSRHEREDAFADELAACVQRADLRARFLISIREDAYAGLGDLFRGRLPNVYANFLHLDYLDRDGAREAILKPVERHNEEHGTSVAVEPALVDAVLDQVQRNRFVVSENGRPDGDGADARAGSQAIETTYLQLVLKRLWDEEAAEGSDVLRLATLERLGGAETITETHLAGSMAKLPPDQQSAAASAFRYLVTARGTKIALTVRELSEMAELPESRLEPVLRRLAAGDLHILRPVALPDPGDEASYEIFHDALARPIRRWRQEREDAERAELRAQKEEAERHALEAQRREERERRRRRLALRGLAVAVAGCLGLAVALVVVFRADANHQRRVDKSIESAERIADLADSPRFGPAAAALASVEASRGLAPTFQARSQTLAALQLDVGLPRIGVGHTRPVLSVAFLPGTSLLVSGSSDGSVRLWDGRADQVGAPLLTSSDAVVSAVAVRAGAGSRIVAAARGDDETIDLWDVTRPRKPRHLRTLHVSAYVNTVAFSPDGRLLASGDDDGRITLWTLAGTSARKLRGGAGALGAVYGLAFGADGRYLASASDPGGTEVWRVDDLTARGARPKPVVLTEDDSRSIAWSADGKLAVGVDERSDEPGIRLWTVRGRHPVAGRTRFLSTSDVVYGLAFARGGSALVSGGANWAVTTWDVRTGRAFGPPRMQDARDVNGVAVSPDGDTIASAGDDQLVRIWPLEPHRTLATIVGGRGFDDLAGGRSFHLPDVWDLALGPRGVVAVAADDGGVLLFRGSGATRVPQPVTRIGTGDPAWAVAFHGDTLAVAAGPAFRLYDTGSSCTTMPASPCARGGSAAHPFHTDSIERVEFDRSGRVLASAGDDGAVNLWDVSRPGRVRHLGRLPGERVKILALAFDPAADVLAVGDDVGRIGLWRVGVPSHPAPLGETVVGHEHQSVDSLAFSPDGTLLASGGEDQQVALWQVDPERGTKRLPQSLSQSNSVLAVAFSPDGRILAAGDGDGSTCLYDVASLRFIGTTDCLLSDYSSTANLSGIRRVAFAPDGKTLFTAGTATPVVAWSSLLWSLDRGAEDRLGGDVCRIAGRNLTAGEWHLAFANTPIADHRRRTCSHYPLP